MNDAPQAPTHLEPAPGARAAWLCGLWSILLSLTCVGLPIGIALAIVALVQNAKAKRLARENPDFYTQPAGTGMVLGIIGLVMPIVMLPFLGIVSAIAIPALLSQRARARDMAVVATLATRTGDLVGQFDKQRAQGTAPEQIPGVLETYLVQQTDKNPWNPTEPASRAHLEVVTGLDRDGMEAEARSEAVELGQSVFVLELPAPDPLFPGSTRLGYLAGAARVQNEIHGERTVVKVVEVE